MDSKVSTPLYAAGIAAILHNQYIGEKNMMKNAWVGVASASGLYLGQMLHPMLKRLYIPSLAPSLYNSKAVIERGADIGISFATAYAINTYVLNNVELDDEYWKFAGILLASHVGAVYVSEYMHNKALAYLTSDDM